MVDHTGTPAQGVGRPLSEGTGSKLFDIVLFIFREQMGRWADGIMACLYAIQAAAHAGIQRGGGAYRSPGLRA